jgi:hypothetical protein
MPPLRKTLQAADSDDEEEEHESPPAKKSRSSRSSAASTKGKGKGKAKAKKPVDTDDEAEEDEVHFISCYQLSCCEEQTTLLACSYHALCTCFQLRDRTMSQHT